MARVRRFYLGGPTILVKFRKNIPIWPALLDVSQTGLHIYHLYNLEDGRLIKPNEKELESQFISVVCKNSKKSRRVSLFSAEILVTLHAWINELKNRDSFLRTLKDDSEQIDDPNYRFGIRKLVREVQQRKRKLIAHENHVLVKEDVPALRTDLDYKIFSVFYNPQRDQTESLFASYDSWIGWKDSPEKANKDAYIVNTVALYSLSFDMIAEKTIMNTASEIYDQLEASEEYRQNRMIFSVLTERYMVAFANAESILATEKKITRNSRFGDDSLKNSTVNAVTLACVKTLFTLNNAESKYEEFVKHLKVVLNMDATIRGCGKASSVRDINIFTHPASVVRHKQVLILDGISAKSKKSFTSEIGTNIVLDAWPNYDAVPLTIQMRFESDIVATPYLRKQGLLDYENVFPMDHISSSFDMFIFPAGEPQIDTRTRQLVPLSVQLKLLNITVSKLSEMAKNEKEFYIVFTDRERFINELRVALLKLYKEEGKNTGEETKVTSFRFFHLTEIDEDDYGAYEEYEEFVRMFNYDIYEREWVFQKGERNMNSHMFILKLSKNDE